MWAEPDVLKDGAAVSRNAGKIALSGADALAQASIPPACSAISTRPTPSTAS